MDCPESETIFTYAPLEDVSEQIRLLSIRPSAQSDTHIALTLTQWRLREVPPYAALSYTWGDATNKVKISVNDKIHLVTQNCAYALWQLRQQQSEYCWVDSICIDQGSIPERNAQVRIMGQIFSTANVVFVSLGRCLPGNNEHLLQYMTTIKLHDQENIRQYEEDAKSLIKIFQGLRILCAHEYWSRAWILQEFVLARELVILQGSGHWAFEILRELVARRYDWDDPVCCYSRDPHEFIRSARRTAEKLDSYVGDLFSWRESFADQAEHRKFDQVPTTRARGTSLANMLKLVKDRKCADLRDRIFSVLPIIYRVDRDRHLREVPPRFELEINYGWSREKLLERVCFSFTARPSLYLSPENPNVLDLDQSLTDVYRLLHEVLDIKIVELARRKRICFNTVLWSVERNPEWMSPAAFSLLLHRFDIRNPAQRRAQPVPLRYPARLARRSNCSSTCKQAEVYQLMAGSSSTPLLRREHTAWATGKTTVALASDSSIYQITWAHSDLFWLKTPSNTEFHISLPNAGHRVTDFSGLLTNFDMKDISFGSRRRMCLGIVNSALLPPKPEELQQLLKTLQLEEADLHWCFWHGTGPLDIDAPDRSSTRGRLVNFIDEDEAATVQPPSNTRRSLSHGAMLRVIKALEAKYQNPRDAG